MEQWKPVVGYEGYYEVSDFGRVRRIDHSVKTGIKHNDTKIWRGRVLKQNKKRNGYFTVDLCKENKVKTILVHRIVATAFCPKESGKEYVNHINCDRADNRACNLEWCTDEYNKQYAKELNRYHNPSKKTVCCKQTRSTFESSYKAAEWVNEVKFGNSKQTKNIAAKIRSCCLGLQKVAYGFTWEYL